MEAKAERMDRADPQTHLIEFVLAEARALDEARYDDWLALFADDGHYWVPLTARASRIRSDKRRSPTRTGCCWSCASNG